MYSKVSFHSEVLELKPGSFVITSIISITKNIILKASISFEVQKQHFFLPFPS